MMTETCALCHCIKWWCEILIETAPCGLVGYKNRAFSIFSPEVINGHHTQLYFCVLLYLCVTGEYLLLLC